MKTKSTICAVLIIAVSGSIYGQSAFTYQGRLQISGTNATGLYDLQFALYNNQSGGAQIGSTITRNSVPTTNGLFTVSLDFGSGMFDGSARWLQIAVRSNAAGAFTLLDPRQPVTPAPEAIFAKTAGTVPAGSLTSTQLAPGAVTSEKIANGQVVRSINFLTDNVGIVPGEGLTLNTVGNTLQLALLPPSCLTYSNCYWSLLGNGNITPGVHFLGTVAGETAPLEFRVNNATAMRYEPSGSVPNIIGGHGGNSVMAGVMGATIGGGGQTTEPNVNESNFGTIGGGSGNVISKSYREWGTISGGSRNFIGAGWYNTIGGGYLNVTFRSALGPESFSTIAGGAGNAVAGEGATIGGGMGNVILGDSGTACTIAGGMSNAVHRGAELSTVGGGERNNIGGFSDACTIGGGRGNTIANPAVGTSAATIGGGEDNVIGYQGANGTIGGGSGNVISAGANAVNATIGGGANNGVSATHSTISGGASNVVGQSASGSSIGGGEENTIQNNSGNATIAGGHGNTIWEGGLNSTIAGGTNNSIGSLSGGEGCTIGGGSLNSVSGEFSTIAGGYGNYAGRYALSTAIGGGRANYIGSFSANCTISGGAGNIIYSQSQSETIGGGEGNIIQADGSVANVIGGGRNNQIEIGVWSGTISGGESNRLRHITSHGSIGGGTGNFVQGNYGTVSGGKANTIDWNGHYGTIPGGRDNTATREAFAAGTAAQAIHQGAFVWSASDGTVSSTNENSVTMRAGGGYRLFSDAAATVGAHLASGSGSWTAMSDRNAKENFEAVSPREVLEKVAALPVQRWNYKTQDRAVRHIGPTAQDFKAAFEVGESDTGISTVDADGVALAAIQGLNQKLEEKDAEIRELRAALKTIQMQLGELTRGHPNK